MLGRPQGPLRGQECWGGISPQPQLCPTSHAGAARGIPPVSQQTRGRARGSPKGAVRDNSGFPRRAGALHGAFFASQRKLINPFANPPFESYRWLMFIEVFYLELISLKSVLMFAKIHTVPVPSCVRLLAPFFISAFFAYIVAGVKWGNAQSWEIKDVNFINRNQRS